MTQSVFTTGFAPVRKLFPKWLSTSIRSLGTALLTPVVTGYRTGHFRSSFKMAAVSRRGDPIPWYTYPIIEFLSYRDYSNKIILEFGGGQSTLWWAQRSQTVVTCEGNREWYDKLRDELPGNVELHYTPMLDRQTNVSQVIEVLSSKGYLRYDVIVIDGLYRHEMIDIACKYVAPDGVIICDDAEGYAFYEGFRKRGLNRVDFYGNVPGVILPHCTSIYFTPSSFAFDPAIPIRVIAEDV